MLSSRVEYAGLLEQVPFTRVATGSLRTFLDLRVAMDSRADESFNGLLPVRCSLAGAAGGDDEEDVLGSSVEATTPDLPARIPQRSGVTRPAAGPCGSRVTSAARADARVRAPSR